ncbi:MAG: TlpA disulfide reductase family protein [Bacteroidetes bacterium]|nr:TlpA disulfide reductase family protein [Bacteroidota bacterium]
MRFFSFYFFLFITLISCQQHSYKTIVVKGNVKNSISKKIALISFGSSNNAIVLDTAIIDKQGNYSLKSLSNEEELYAVKIEGLSEIWLANDVNEIALNIDANHFKKYIVAGSKASQKIHDFVAIIDSVYTLQKSSKICLDSLETQKGKDSLTSVVKQDLKSYKNYLTKYCNNELTAINSAALQCFYLFYISKINAIEPHLLNKHIQAACTKYPNSSQLTWFKNSYAEYIKVNPKFFLVDEIATDFDFLDIDSNKISLKSFAGKYLLINFWQSKSMDCIKENDRIKNYYAKYKDKNLEVLSISLDSNSTSWSKVVKKDSLQWKHVRDTLFFNSSLIKKYNISSLPSSVLINPSKKIIAIDLMGEKLKEKLQDLFD